MGASAGGFEALEHFFAALPPDTGLAFVLIPHLHPRHRSMMAELLARATEMAVCEAADGMRLEANHVYVAPPGAELSLDGEVLRVHRTGAARPPHVVDAFLCSLAEARGGEAIGMILSGTGSDGALGIQAIKEHGGTTMAQAEGSATHFGMPRSAIATGSVDYVLPVEDLAHALVDHVQYRRTAGAGSGRGIATQLATLFALLRKVTGHDFARYRQPTIIRRVQRRMRLLGLEQPGDYIERLRADEGEVRQLFQDLLIGVTQFFRDPDAFAALAARGLAPMLATHGGDRPLRVWVPGCSSGEEAYSIAMLVDEQIAARNLDLPIQIFATDIDGEQLRRARAGVYPESIAAAVGPDRLERYFVREGASYQVGKGLRELMIFSVHNLLMHPSFSRLDLISCRNLLIYLDPALQRRLLPLFHRALNPGGLLFLGSAETINGFTHLFSAVDRKARIFRRKEGVSVRPVLAPLALPERLAGADAPEASASGRRRIGAIVERRLLGRYAPPCILVDERGEIVHFHGRTGRYLEAPEGAPNRELLRMARPELRFALRELLRDAAASGRTVVREDVDVHADGDLRRIHLTVEPVEQQGLRHFLVVFEEREPLPERAPAAGATVSADAKVEDLQRELASTREDLQATIQELELSNEQLRSSNEDLSSMNEELQSANEELETSKEELQAVTEELETVNTELSTRVEELRRANSDFQNLLASTQIPTIFLGPDLRVRGFTPPSVEVFGLIAGDVGRLLTDVAPRFECTDLAGDLREVLRTESPTDREVRTRSGQWYILRILPYRSVDGANDGVVLTFVDITERKRSEYELRLLLRELDHRVKNTLAAVQSIAEESARSAGSLPDFVEAFRARIDALARLHTLLTTREARTVALRQVVETTVAPFCRGPGSLRVEGEAPPLPAATARSVGMALNELALNAVKYGALSTPEGQVTLSCDAVPRPEGSGLRIVWRESGGPSVVPPSRRGFGSVLIEEAIPYELGGETTLAFPADGVRCEIVIPASQLAQER